MARLARVVAAGLPHHVTQRGNRRQDVFFGDADYETYIELLAEGCRKAKTALERVTQAADHDLANPTAEVQGASTGPDNRGDH